LLFHRRILSGVLGIASGDPAGILLHLTATWYVESPVAEDDDVERPERATPHDSLFKLAFQRPENASGLLRSLLPSEVVARLDFSTLELVPGSFCDVELRDVETDLLFRVELEGQETFVYALLEHQSTVDPTMAWRLLRYMVRIWESWTRDHAKATKLPVILPIVVSHASAPWTAPTSFVELLGVSGPLRQVLEPLLVSFRYVVDDLTAQSPEALRERANVSPMARLTLFLLQRARSSEDLLGELRAWLGLLDQVRAAGGDDLVSIVVYSWVVADVAPAQWRAFLRDELNTEPDDVMGAAEKFIAQMVPWKLERARAEAEAKAKAEVVLRQLARRFGAPAASIEARVRAATTDELDAMADRVLDATSVADVVGD
jgi:predicted transposase/invertase (TIGR01784 family)